MAACRMKETMDSHQSVLMDEVLENLSIVKDGIYVDATFGRGGHAAAILGALGRAGKLFALDKDPEAVSFAKQKFSTDKRFLIRHGSFNQLRDFVNDGHVLGKVSGVLFDLGVSSPQLDDAERGFSFMREGKLDMRMDSTTGITAAEWINAVSEEALAKVLWELGEERFSKRIARAVISARQQAPLQTTHQLAEIIKTAHPRWQPGRHPATKSFQAIRMYINHELEDIEKGLEQAYEVLKIGGRLLVISFHSLEDRLVKQFIQKNEKAPPSIMRKLPIKQTFVQKLKRVGHAIKPSAEEIAMNPRSRSATLRIAEKLS